MNLSTNKNKILFHLEYEHVWIDHPLDLVIKIDDRTLHMDVSGAKSTTIDKKISVEPGDHLLTLSVSNKNNRSTVVDEHNNILADSYVKIKKLFIDEIDFGRIMLSESKHVDNNNNITISPGGVYTNGTWSLNFTTPVYIWLLEKLF
tara:strand:- start:2428 stop:2868 length:441 start_codon:yes stop_codon:yes gene_type:complete